LRYERKNSWMRGGIARDTPKRSVTEKTARAGRLPSGRQGGETLLRTLGRMQPGNKRCNRYMLCP